jgi:hypothetical protein
MHAQHLVMLKRSWPFGFAKPLHHTAVEAEGGAFYRTPSVSLSLPLKLARLRSYMHFCTICRVASMLLLPAMIMRCVFSLSSCLRIIAHQQTSCFASFSCYGPTT